MRGWVRKKEEFRMMSNFLVSFPFSNILIIRYINLITLD